MMLEKSTTALDGDAVISIADGELTIKNFQTSDPDIVDYFEKQQDEIKQERFVSALRTGVMALKSTDISERVDYVEKKFEKLHNNFENKISGTFDDLVNLHDGIFGENGQMRDIMTEHFGENGILLKEVFDPNNEQSPLYKIMRGFQIEFSTLRAELGIKETEEDLTSRTTLKGAEFEDMCREILEKPAKVFGDTIEDTTSNPGNVKRSKKGDLVLTVADSSKKIAIEIKDVGTISANKITDTLDEAIENRAASFGILVAKSVESFPREIGWFQEIGGNKLVVALGSESEDSFHEELLLIAYKWARTKVNSQNSREKQVDAEAIDGKIQSIRKKIKKMSTIKTDCSNIEKTSKHIKTVAEEIVNEITDELDDMNKSLENKK
jgi:hypothetical protein